MSTSTLVQTRIYSLNPNFGTTTAPLNTMPSFLREQCHTPTSIKAISHKSAR
ncbi:hypothetical protein BKA81DRAFT_355519 [Phyllosticta paracitricarpa]